MHEFLSRALAFVWWSRLKGFSDFEMVLSLPNRTRFISPQLPVHKSVETSFKCDIIWHACFFSCQCVCKLATLRCVDVSAFLFKDQNDFLHQTVDGSVRGCTEKNSCPSRLGLKVPRRSSTVSTLTRYHTQNTLSCSCSLRGP